MVTIERKEFLRKYKEIYERGKMFNNSFNCIDCPLKKFFDFDNSPNLLSNEHFSSCGYAEFSILKRFLPKFTKKQFLRITGGKSVFCSSISLEYADEGMNTPKAAKKLFELLSNGRGYIKI